MFWRTRCSASESRSEPRVAAIDLQAQRTFADLDQWVWSVLQARGPMTLSGLVARVADQMYDEALSQGAASVDIGMFGAKLFHAEAAAVVERGDGIWWAIDKGR